MILSQIVAVAKNGVIGKNNNLPWHLPEDLKFFREKTKGKILIMGRKTFESLPSLLKGRYHMVVSRSAPATPPVSTPETPVEFFTSIEAAVSKARALTEGSPKTPEAKLFPAEAVPLGNTNGKWPDEVFIAGGSEIFRLSFPMADRVYLTKIHHDVDGDVYLPELDFSRMKIADQADREEPYPFSFILYIR